MKVSLLYVFLKMESTASKSKPKSLTTKSGIPLLASRKELPAEYIQDFTIKSKKPEEKAEAFDEKAEVTKEAVIGPRFTLNVTAFVYEPRKTITAKGEFKVQKGITWLHG